MPSDAVESTWTLYIVFHGLCLIVQRQPLVVLLPRNDPREEKHIAWMEYDRSHLRAASSKLSGNVERPVIEDLDILVDPLCDDKFSPGPPKTVFDFSRHPAVKAKRRKVNPAYLLAKPTDPSNGSPALHSRITLTHGRFKKAAPGSCWSVDGGPTVELTYSVTWRITKIRQPALLVYAKPLPGGRRPPLPEWLYPVQGAMTIHIFHVTDEDHLAHLGHLGHRSPGKGPHTGKPPQHIRAFDRLLLPGDQTLPLLVREDRPCRKLERPHAGPIPERSRLTTTFSCMIATARVDGS